VDGELEVVTDAAVPQVDGVFVTAAPVFTVRPERRTPGQRDGDVLLGQVGMGLTVGDDVVHGQARVHWVVRQGSAKELGLDVTGVGPDLELTGANVRSWTRSGNTVAIELQQEATALVAVKLTWTQAVGSGAELSARVPAVRPLGVTRLESRLQLARDGELEVIPRTGGRAISTGELPRWGSGLVEGTPTASYAFAAAPTGSMQLSRLELVSGPPVVVDVASVTAALTDEGRVLMRAHYEVRNDRAGFLAFTAPDGLQVLGVRVGGQTAMPALTDGTWRIPLLRSVDTVEGLLSFPVEVVLLGERRAWARRESRTVPLPVVHAPIAATRVSLHLPPGYEDRLKPGDGGKVDAFTEGDGISYGLGWGDVGAAEADALFQSAVSAWMSNSFDEAQGALDDLRSLGGSNENVVRLQSNLDLVEGRRGEGDDVVSRRVRDQAKARAKADYDTQADLEREADELYRAGSYGSSAVVYKRALELNATLEKLEQGESVEQERWREEASAVVQDAEDKFKEVVDSGVLAEDTVEEIEEDIDFFEFDGAEASGFFDFEDEEPDTEPVDVAAFPGAAVIDSTDLHRIPAGRSHQSVVRRSRRLGKKSSHKTPAADVGSRDQSGTAPIATGETGGLRPRSAAGSDSSGKPATLAAPPAVHASALSVYIPTTGRLVRYQRLLLPEDASWEVPIEAVGPSRRSR